MPIYLYEALYWQAWIKLGLVKNNHCLKYVKKCLKKNFPCLGKAQCKKKERYHLVRAWQHKKLNCKAHHIFQHLLRLAGAQVLCLKNKMLPGLFQETKTTIMTARKKLKNFIYSAWHCKVLATYRIKHLNMSAFRVIKKLEKLFQYHGMVKFLRYL